MEKVAVIGTTSWGFTLAKIHADKGNDVRLWTRTEREARKLKKKGLDPVRFPDVVLPEQIAITSNLKEAMDGVNAVLLAIPSASMRQNITKAAVHLTRSMIIISAAKGLEVGSNKRMSEVIAEEINPRYVGNICSLSGPRDRAG